MDKQKVTILLVDDHQVLRDGLRALLETEDDLEVIGDASSGEEAVELARQLEPDVVVMDLGLPEMSGFEASQEILTTDDQIKIVILSMHIKRDFVAKAIEIGCAGFVPKSTTHESLLEAIHTVQDGENYLHPTAASALFESMTGEPDPRTLFSELTDREQEVIRLAAMGFTSQDIGEKLVISPNTVDTYRHRAYNKLNINSRADLIKFAAQVGILDELKGS